MRELEKPLLSPVDFSQYQGQTSFVFNGEGYHLSKRLGEGGFGFVNHFISVSCHQVAVKSEIPDKNNYYTNGLDFKKEADYYHQVYGLGVFSGSLCDIKKPHYILIPFFSGDPLCLRNFTSEKELLSCWIRGAYAVQQLHAKNIVHGDIKSDNIIFGMQYNPALKSSDEDAFVIDFGLAEQIGGSRGYAFPDRKKLKSQYWNLAPELFSNEWKQIYAEIAQDIYALGMMLKALHHHFAKSFYFDNDTPDNFEGVVNTVKDNMTLKNPSDRWSIPQAIYMLSVSFFSRIPKALWEKQTHLLSLNSNATITEIWKKTASSAISVRLSELESEQMQLRKKSSCKAEKINGLKKLMESDIRISDPLLMSSVIRDTTQEFPALPTGIFSHRTKTLLDELVTVAPTFH